VEEIEPHPNDKLRFNTKSIHGKVLKRDIHHAIKFPIYAGVAYDFASAEDLEATFADRKPAHAYSRITNPTVEAFENKMTALENGFASIAVASGMAATTNVFLNILQQGDHLIAASALFGGTCSLFKNVLRPFGVETTFVDIDNPDENIGCAVSRQRILSMLTERSSAQL